MPFLSYSALTLVTTALITIITRLVPFARWGLYPLGTDWAIYHKTLTECFKNMPGCPRAPEAWLAYPFHVVFNMSPDHILSFGYVALNLILGVVLYYAAREYFGTTPAVYSAIIFALSIPQFLFFWTFFLRMTIAVIVTLISFILIKKESWWAAPIIITVGWIHPLTFFPLALALVAHACVTDNKRYACILLAASVIGIVIYRFENIAGLFYYLAQYTTATPAADQSLLAGNFINPSFYQYSLAWWYIPFGIFGIVGMARARRFNMVFWYAIINGVLVLAQFIFHNRFLILLDITLIITAGSTLAVCIHTIAPTNFLKGACALLIIVGGIYEAKISWQMEPLTNARETAEIRTLQNTNENIPLTIHDPLYADILYGYGGRLAETTRGELFFVYEGRRGRKTDTPTANVKRLSDHLLISFIDYNR